MSSVGVARPGALADRSEGMSYLSTRSRRLVTVYMPLAPAPASSTSG
jgi:hypothetical protein